MSAGTESLSLAGYIETVRQAHTRFRAGVQQLSNDLLGELHRAETSFLGDTRSLISALEEVNVSADEDRIMVKRQ